MMDIQETLKELERQGLKEVACEDSFITYFFRGYRTNKDGNEQEVLIELYDYRTENPFARYKWKARTGDGKKTAIGHAYSSTEGALRNVPWSKLD
jgi:hypothetical protein